MVLTGAGLGPRPGVQRAASVRSGHASGSCVQTFRMSAAKIGARLDSAGLQVDLADRLGGRAHDRAAVDRRADPVSNERNADFILEVLVREYGIAIAGTL